MLAGFVDGRGRAYDIGFRTLRLYLTDAEGVLATGPGESVVVQGRATVSMELLDPKPVPLLLPLPSELAATRQRVVAIASPGVLRRQPPTFFNVSLGLHPSALEHFFTVEGGREFAQFAKADVESSAASGSAATLVLRGPRPGAPSESVRYRMRIEPRSLADQALAALV